MKYHIHFDTCIWSLLDDKVDSDITGKKRIWKLATLKLLEMYEKEAKFDLSICPLVLEELEKKPGKNKTAINFIKKHNIPSLEFDVFYGFMLGSAKHGVLGVCPLGADVHPTSNLIDCNRKLSKDKQSNDRYILKHNINNDIDFLITTNEKDLNNNEDVKILVKLPDEFLRLLESN